MNPKLQFIFSRRSIRKYTPTDIPENLVRDLLAAGMSAPSAVKKDPWNFIIIRDKNTLQKIAEHLPNGKMLANASLGIIVCGDIEKAHDKQESYMLQDCSACMENILLAANALGLGACWLGVHPRKDRILAIKKIFDLPDNIIPIAGISIGFPAEEKKARTRYQEDKVHYEKW